ncbi:HisA/HisF-related TIM barrel protein, partial [Nitrolancea hollandica]|uniref:HisA/HisF-related TIM barrel protein n=1 Tax=Nitrolancea hollandica TaxID=1206749 RepID=UPI001EE66B6A
MLVIPAIDLLQGRCVRLFQGDFAQETIYDDDPVRVAHHWAALGARWLHIVDLDGARLGRPAQLALVA